MTATAKPKTHIGDLESLRQSPAFTHLVTQPRWVCWKWTWRGDKSGGGKWTKPPLMTHGLANAKSDDPSTWGSFDLACDSVRAGRADGIGVMLLGADIGAADLDHCRDADTGIVDTWAENLYQQSGGAYREVTASGTGLRLIGRTAGDRVHRKFNGSDGAAIELYRNCERYITVSGYQTNGCGELPSIDAFIDDLVAKFDGATPPPQRGEANGHATGGVIDLNDAGPQQPHGGVDYDDILENGAPEGQRNEAFNAEVWSLANRGLSFEEILERLQQNPDGIARKYLDQGGPKRLAKKARRCYDKWQAKKQWQVVGAAQPGQQPGPGVTHPQSAQQKPWPTIYVYPDELPRVLGEAEQALILLGRLYQRGSFIVKPAEQRLHVSGEPCRYLLPMTVDGMRDYFTRSARFLYRDRRAKTGSMADACSYEIARGYLSREGERNLPVLEGISSVPLIRADGSILDVPGYDPRSGMIFEPGSMRYPSMSHTPTKQDALEALRILKGYIQYFPFVPQADDEGKVTGLFPSRSVALSGFLTAIHRRTLVSSPLHGFSAPGAGHGKGLLADAISTVLTGDTAAPITYTRSEEENEKRLGAQLIGDPQMIFFDNVTYSLEGDFLNMMLTQRSAQTRILGRSKTVRVLTNTFVCATGINLAVTGSGGMRRRMVLCEIDAKTDHPEYRKFPGPPLLEAVSADRAKIVIAILTILRAWRLARESAGIDVHPLGGFEDWSAYVRKALIWLGEADPCATIEKLQLVDSVRDLTWEVLEQWEQTLGLNVPYKAEEIIQIATGMTPKQAQQLNLNLAMQPNTALFLALLGVAGNASRSIDRMRLQYWLRSMNNNRDYHPYRIVRTGTVKHAGRWALMKD
jgi:hypothetical protein